jgi:type IV pilus assembly protein PilC
VLLRKQGVNPNKVNKERSSIFSSRNKPVKAADIAYLIRQVATMMKAGVPLLQGLDIVGNGAEKVKLKELIYTVRNDVNGGTDFSSALARHPEHFDDLVCSLVTPVSSPVRWRPCLTESRPTRKRSSRSRKKSRKL